MNFDPIPGKVDNTDILNALMGMSKRLEALENKKCKCQEHKYDYRQEKPFSSNFTNLPTPQIRPIDRSVDTKVDGPPIPPNIPSSKGGGLSTWTSPGKALSQKIIARENLMNSFKEFVSNWNKFFEMTASEESE